MISNLLAWSEQALILVAVAALMQNLLRLRVPRAELLLLQTILAAMLLLPFTQPWVHPIEWPASSEQTIVVPPGRVALTPKSTRVGGIDLDVERTVVGVFAGGVVLRLAWLGLGMLSLARYRRTARPAAPDFEAEDLTGARAEFAVSPEVSGPVTFGWRRPVVLVPLRFLDMPAQQRRAIACHELLHVRRRDWLSCLAEEVAAALMWFHPGVWYLLGRIHNLREQVVDAEAVMLTQARQPYIEALLAMAVARPIIDVAAAPLFLRKRDLARRVKILIEENPMSKVRILASYACVLVAVVAAAAYATAAFPLMAAPQAPPGVIARIDLRRLPDSVRPQVEARVMILKGQPFTSAVMTEVNEDLVKIDPRIVRQWIEEKPGVYSLSITYTTGAPPRPPTLSLIDTSRLPESLRAQATQGLEPFLNAPFTDALIESVRSAVLSVDRKIALKWFADPDGSMVLAAAYDLPEQAWQPIFGVFVRLDVSQVPEPLRSQVEQRLARFVNGPFSNTIMREIDREVRGVAPKLVSRWRTESNDTFSLTLVPDNGPFAPIR